MSRNIMIVIFHRIHFLLRYTIIIHSNLYDKRPWSLPTFLWFQNIEKISGSWVKPESFACGQLFQPIGWTYLKPRTHLYTHLYSWDGLVSFCASQRVQELSGCMPTCSAESTLRVPYFRWGGQLWPTAQPKNRGQIFVRDLIRGRFWPKWQENRTVSVKIAGLSQQPDGQKFRKIQSSTRYFPLCSNSISSFPVFSITPYVLWCVSGP
jgi:hypothetical protein